MGLLFGKLIAPVPSPIVEVIQCPEKFFAPRREVVGDGDRSIRLHSPADHIVFDEFVSRNFEAGRSDDGSSPLSKNGEQIDGTFFRQSSFATHSVVTERNAVNVADDAPLELLGPLGCGVKTGARGVINSPAPDQGPSLVIFEAESVGLGAPSGAKLVGCSELIRVDLDHGRLEKASELDRGADYTLETTGQPSVLKQATEVLASAGECGVIGASPGGDGGRPGHKSHPERRPSTQGIVEGDSAPKEFIPDLLNLYERGEFPFDELVSFYDFAETNQAIDDVELGNVIKPVSQMNS